MMAKITAEEKRTASEREQIKADIARMEEAIRAGREKLEGLDKALDEKKALFEAEKQAALSKLGADAEMAKKYAEREIVDVTELQEEAATADRMRRHLREYARMRQM